MDDDNYRATCAKNAKGILKRFIQELNRLGYSATDIHKFVNEVLTAYQHQHNADAFKDKRLMPPLVLGEIVEEHPTYRKIVTIIEPKDCE